MLISSKAGIMEEMLEDTLDMDEDEDLEDEADAEVDKVLFDLTNGKLGEAGSVATDLPVSREQYHLVSCPLNSVLDFTGSVRG
jgi:charged multivesicular body protein 3